MKAYLKNGKTIRITQQIANDIADMKIKQAAGSKNATNILISRHVINKNVFLMVDIDDIIAVC